jgi:hypothetical protein
LKYNFSFDTIFGGKYGFFETGDDKISDFIGQESDKGLSQEYRYTKLFLMSDDK